MSLADKIFNLASFKRQYKVIAVESCSSSFTSLERNNQKNDIDWNNMISCGSILSLSDNFDHQSAALRIAQTCLETSTASESQKVASAILLDNLTNRPAIQLAINRDLIAKEYEEKIPLPITLDITKRKILHTLSTPRQDIYLNKFQKKAYETFISSDVVSVSAPTSAGKSFLLSHTIIHFIEDSNFPINFVYIVPTRALINQVERDFKTIVEEAGLKDVYISSVPKFEQSVLKQHKIFVFTQERLHWFRIENPNFQFDYLIVDEAQKISEGNRGILLQQTIEELIEHSPAIKIFYSSPLTSNPEILFSDISDTKSKQSVNTEFVAVNQNLIYVSQVPKKSQKWELTLLTGEEKINIGWINLASRPLTELKKIALIVNSLSKGSGGNIIYMNGPAFAERIANVLYDIVDDDSSNVPEIKNLIEFTKKVVHKDYLLAKVLNKKIAFHYGNMPVLIRHQIENLFDKGIIKYLICTSTLLEGVNLPAKNIFLRKPNRGNGNPLDNAEFWNLAGRAGRLGKEFQGNIVCIDPSSWKTLPSNNRKKNEIVKSIDKMALKVDELIDFLQKGTPRLTATLHPELEYALTYYYSKYLNSNLSPSLLKVQALIPELERISQKIEVPNEIILRNPGISPLAQQNLLDFFKERKGEISNFIPILPEAQDALESYITIVTLTSRFFSGDTEKLSYYHALLVVNWMRGYPLAVIISSNINYWTKRAKTKKAVALIIRDTMKDVEEYARFKFAKYSSCYIDILRYFLINSNQKKLSDDIPNLNIWLEFGVSQMTQVSLISLGVTRQSAIMLSEFIGKDNLTKDEAREWIFNNDIYSLQLSQIVISDIEKAVGILQKGTG